MASVQISLLQSGEEPEWDRFVTEAPAGTFFHLSGWKRVIEAAFGHQTYYLSARRRGAICGVLPLTHIKSTLFGTTLVSNAFAIRGGPIAEDEAAAEELTQEAIRIARKLRVGFVEFRSAGQHGVPWQEKTGLYFIFRKELEQDAPANLKRLPHTRRRMIRVAREKGLTSRIEKDVSNLHHVYAQMVRHLGTPVFHRSYFRLLKEEFGPACEILTVFHGEDAVASVMSFYFRDEITTYYGGGTMRARQLAANDFLYWEVMQQACDRGTRFFDFGRSKIGTGAFEFKRTWGFAPEPLSYQFYPIGRSNIPEINPLNPKFSLAIKLWRQLPLPVTKILGPPIVRSLG